MYLTVGIPERGSDLSLYAVTLGSAPVSGMNPRLPMQRLTLPRSSPRLPMLWRPWRRSRPASPPYLTHLVGHPGTLAEGPVPNALYGGVADEGVLAAVIRRDKAVALLIAEPLHRSLGHMPEPTFNSQGSRPNKKPPLSLGGGAIK